jgi:hypothetical protein
MKLTTVMMAVALAVGTAWGQSPNIIQNTKTQLQNVQQQKTAASNAALAGSGSAAKPSPAAPTKTASTAVKSAAPAAPAPAKPVIKAAPAKTVVRAKTPVAAPKAAVATAGVAEEPKPAEKKPEEKKYSMTGKRDPFISPVVSRQGGSGCSTGKKCLDIDQIAVRGVVKSDNGMIAVVTNGLNKAYFLRENDPVFNGYVLKITVDSVVFKQNFQDRLGKPFTKDVVKRLTTPAV